MIEMGPNLKKAILLDSMCWFALAACIFIGPVWITKIAIVLLMISHMTVLTMIYRLKGLYTSQELGRTASNLMRDMFEQSSERVTRRNN